MKIIFMGTPEFAVPSLEALIKAGHDVTAAVTRPDRPKGRGMEAAAPPVKLAAARSGIRVLQPVKIREAGFIDLLKAERPDLIVVVAFGRILPEEILDIPPCGCINVHASILPGYRGASPVNRAVMNGERETGVATMLLDRGMDTGPVYLIEKTAIGEDETASDLAARLSVMGAALLVKTIELISGGRIKPTPQDEGKATCAPVLKKEDGLINWRKGAGEIHNLVRGVYPWPGAYTRLNGRLMKIHRGRVAVDFPGTPSPSAPAGSVVLAPGGRLGVKCGDNGIFEILEVQPESKRRLFAPEFLKGHQLENGDRFD